MKGRRVSDVSVLRRRLTFLGAGGKYVSNSSSVCVLRVVLDTIGVRPSFFGN